MYLPDAIDSDALPSFVLERSVRTIHYRSTLSCTQASGAVNLSNVHRAARTQDHARSSGGPGKAGVASYAAIGILVGLTCCVISTVAAWACTLPAVVNG